MNDVVRIAAVEDEPRYRASLKTVLRHAPRLELAASFAAAAPLLEQATRARELGLPLPWDLVLTDLGLPGIDGVELIARLKALHPALPVVALTVFEEPATVLAAICAGADGYLLKSTAADETCRQLEAMAHGHAPLSAALAGTVMRLARNGGGRFSTPLPRDLGLSPRQLDVLRGLVDGASYREIAQRLGVSLDTVRSHVRQIYATLQVHSVAAAVTCALRQGLV